MPFVFKHDRPVVSVRMDQGRPGYWYVVLDEKPIGPPRAMQAAESAAQWLNDSWSALAALMDESHVF